MLKYRVIALTLLVASLLLLIGCGDKKKSSSENGKKIRIVATIGMIGDVAANVGGEHVAVRSLMGPGVDPHTYKASEGDVSRLMGADLILYNGLHLEGKMAEVLEKLSSTRRTVAVAEVIPQSSRLESVQYEGLPDPHVWFDVMLWKQVVGQIELVLIQMDSINAATYSENADIYRVKLDSLHQEVLSIAHQLPANERVLVTAHDAFSYFGRAYGFEVKGLQGISTATEAGTGDVQELVSFIVERKIPAIFVESSLPVRTLEAVQAAVRAKGYDVAIGGELYSDAMGSAGTPDGSYIGMVLHNIRTIVNGLSGDTAETEGSH